MSNVFTIQKIRDMNSELNEAQILITVFDGANRIWKQKLMGETNEANQDERHRCVQIS